MSTRTRVNGFTCWVNLRTKMSGVSLNNVLLDLMSGTNLKVLSESMTGRDLKTVQSMEGLSQQQKVTRTEWIVRELKQCNVIPKDTYVDARLFAMRSADHVFDFLWRLLSHDIWLVWERAEYLQHADPAVLAKVPFEWIPQRKQEDSSKRATNTNKSLSILSGFTNVSEGIEQPTDLTEFDSNYQRFPGSEVCKSYKRRVLTPDSYPKPDDCVLELVQHHLKMTTEGQRLNLQTIEDMADHRVLCCLINSIVPYTFTTEVLPNDRWTIDLCLRTAEKMFHGDSSFSSADLVEGDPMAVGAYLTFFFMIAYKYRQSKAVVDRIDMLNQIIRETDHEISILVVPEQSDSPEKTFEQMKQQLFERINECKAEIARIEKTFDLPSCRNWVDHVILVQKQAHKEIREKIAQRFEIMMVPRNLSINDLCLAMNINLNLTGGSGFYLNTDSKEQLTEYRRVVVRHKDTGEFIDDFTARNKESIRKLLRLRLYGIVDVNPSDYPQYELFFEAPSRNKTLKAGSAFLYQVFPGSHMGWHRQFIKATKENEVESVKNLVNFFQTQPAFINGKEAHTGNTALHWACRMGCYAIVLYLLEHGAGIDILNVHMQSPLFSAAEGMQRKISNLLIEWGCNVNFRNSRGQTAFESIKNDEFRNHLIGLYEYFSTNVPKIVEGDTVRLQELVENHVTGRRELCSLRSRCINGSTLLHTASYFGLFPIVRALLSQRVDVNLLDYKGATPLHRVRDQECMKALIDAGALINIEDNEGNTPLHVKCYGETGKPTDVECVDMLLSNRARLVARNNRQLLPIHCCAMQGRVDALKLLLDKDAQKGQSAGDMLRQLDLESARSSSQGQQQQQQQPPPSLISLALAGDHLDCAKWLVERGFKFKTGELDKLVERVITDQIKSRKQADVLSFLFEHGANANPTFPGGNSALHFAAMTPGNTDALQLLLSHGADVNSTNADSSTPLFFACQTNNAFAAAILLRSGADHRIKNLKGLTAFDLINDYDEWIDSGSFDGEIKARLKAYSLKHSRDLVRMITRKMQGAHPQQQQALGTGGSLASLNVSKALFRPVTPVLTRHRAEREAREVTQQPQRSLVLLPQLLPSAGGAGDGDIPKRYPLLQPPGGYVMW